MILQALLFWKCYLLRRKTSLCQISLILVPNFFLKFMKTCSLCIGFSVILEYLALVYLTIVANVATLLI